MIDVLLTVLVYAVIVIVLLWAFDRLLLAGRSLRTFDHAPEGEQVFALQDGSREAFAELLARVREYGAQARDHQGRQLITHMREAMDDIGRELESDCRFIPVEGAGEGNVRGEWVLAEGANPRRRLLYIHGGGFFAGSPLSHRTITTSLAERLGVAVFALDYRLIPEHPRMAGVEDCRQAWSWIIENGPSGPEPLEQLYTGGDSAGGNLVLSLINWVRDEGHRPADGVFALSPLVDCTFSGPSMRSNMNSDEILGPVFNRLGKLPLWVLHLVFVVQNRVRPANPVVSPVFDDLSGLPPVLVQISDVEILQSDGLRYVNKAVSEGSPVRLQTWAGMLHVWQIFADRLPEGRQAMDEVADFLQSRQST